MLPTRGDVEDARKVARKDWWGEGWFTEPKTLYLDYLQEADYADPAKPIIPEWNRIFGYNGGEK